MVLNNKLSQEEIWGHSKLRLLVICPVEVKIGTQWMHVSAAVDPKLGVSRRIICCLH